MGLWGRSISTYSFKKVEDDRTSKWATNKDQDFIKEFCDTEDLVFDDSVMKTTLVVDYGLVCDNSGTRTILNITYMLGMVYLV